MFVALAVFARRLDGCVIGHLWRDTPQRDASISFHALKQLPFRLPLVGLSTILIAQKLEAEYFEI